MRRVLAVPDLPGNRIWSKSSRVDKFLDAHQTLQARLWFHLPSDVRGPSSGSVKSVFEEPHMIDRLITELFTSGVSGTPPNLVS